MQDAPALLVIRIMLDLLGSDAPRTFSHIAEVKFPNWQHPQPVVAEYPDIELTPLDVLLSNGRGADSFVNEGDALCEFLVGVDDGCLGDAEGCVLAHALDDQRQGQMRWSPD